MNALADRLTENLRDIYGQVPDMDSISPALGTGWEPVVRSHRTPTLICLGRVARVNVSSAAHFARAHLNGGAQ